LYFAGLPGACAARNRAGKQACAFRLRAAAPHNPDG